MCEATLVPPREEPRPAAPSPTIGDIFRRYGPAYRRKYADRMNQDQLKVMAMLVLQHVLPRGFQKVRHYGFAHPRHKVDREWLAMLVTVTLDLVYVLTVRAKPMPIKHMPTCPDCGGFLACFGYLAPERRPWPPRDTS